MKNIRRLYNSENITILILFLFALGIRTAYFISLLRVPGGLPSATDGEAYMESARALLSLSIRSHFNDILYLGYTVILTAFLLVTKKMLVIKFLHIVISAIGVIPMYRIGINLFNKRSAILACIFYAVTFPNIYWSIFILSDCAYVTLLLASIAFLTEYIKTREKRHAVLFAVFLAWTFLVRPPGIISAAFILLYLLIYLDYKKIKEYIANNKKSVAVMGIILLLGVAAVLYSGILRGLYDSLRHFIRWILYEVYGKGQIFDNPNYYDYKYQVVNEHYYFDSRILSFIIQNWKHIIVLFLIRAKYFWTFDIFGQWFYHLNNYILYTFGMIGFVYIVKNSMIKKTSVILLAIASIYMFPIIVFMDGAVRYKMPIFVFIAFISGFGIDRIVEFFSRSFKKMVSNRDCK